MILLTKEINERLDFIGLPDLTVMRNEAGTLDLVGKECGKSILRLSTMPISKKLTVNERTIIIEDYVVPVVVKHSKKLITLVTLMKDTTIEDGRKVLKGELLAKEQLSATTNMSFDYAESTSVPHMYTITDVAGDKWEKSYIAYNVKEGIYQMNIQTADVSIDKLVRESKKAEALADKLCKALKKWKDQEEALQVKTKHIAELQESLQVKCSI